MKSQTNMFQLLRFDKNDPSSVKVEIMYDLSNGSSHRQSMTFNDDSSASHWIVGVMQRYIWEKLNRYVEHKHVLSEKSHEWATDENKMSKLKSLEICFRETKSMKDYPLDTLCSVIVHMEDHLRNILPRMHQVSWRSSLHNMDDLIMQCKEYLSMLKLREKNHHETN